MRELLILFGALIGWILGYVFQLYMPQKRKDEGSALQKELNEAKDTIRRLETQLGQYQHLQEQLNACEIQRQQQTEELESVRIKFTSAEAQIETLQQRLSQYQNLQEQLNTCEAQLQEKTEELEGICAKLTSAETQSETLQQRLASLEQKIQAETTVPLSETLPEAEAQTPPMETFLEVGTKIPEAVEPETPTAETSQVVVAETLFGESSPATKVEIESEVETETPTEESLSKTEPEVKSVRSSTERPDNLRKIEGIGPKVEQLLNEAGILTFEQLFHTKVDRLRAILEEAGGVFKAMDPASWPEQAGLAARGDWEALKILQDQLDGGRYKS